MKNDFSKTLGLGRTARITSEVVVGKYTGKRTTIHRAHDAATGELLGTSTQLGALSRGLPAQGFSLC